MATETLRLDITADSAQAKAELQKLNNQLAIFERAVKKATDPAQIQYLNRNIEFLRGNIQTATTANQKFATGSNQAAFALTNLGRIAQDAPFGFIGIQNNLNPMLESFQRLQKETGSAGSALKAMASSLIGPAGLGLALSVGSALLLTFGDRLFKSGKNAVVAANELSDYAEVVKQTNKNVGDELVTARLLVNAAKDSSLAMNVRLKAIKELRDLQPDVLKNYTDENLLLGQSVNLNNELAASIMKVAKAKAIADKMSKLESERLDAINQKLKIQNATNAETARAAEKSRKKSSVGGLSGGAVPFDVYSKEINDIEQRRIGALAVQDNIIKSIGQRQEFLLSQADKTAIVTALTTKENVKQDGVLKTKVEKVVKITEAKRKELEYEKKIAEARAKWAGAIDGATTERTPFGQAFTPEGMNQAVPQGMEERTLATQQATKTQLDYANALRLTTMNEEQAAEMTNVAMSAFTSLGNAMLQGQDIGEALGNTFKRLIVDLTAMVARALLFKAIMASLSSGVSEIGFAAGGKLGSLLGGLMGFADGGIASGPKSGYPVMLHGTEAVLNPKQFKNLTSNMMNLGAAQGGGAMNLQGEFVVRGQDLVYILNSTNRNNGLLGR
jgi:hypothetical protein